jgi:hypothetical protein
MPLAIFKPMMNVTGNQLQACKSERKSAWHLVKSPQFELPVKCVNYDPKIFRGAPGRAECHSARSTCFATWLNGRRALDQLNHDCEKCVYPLAG